VDVSVRRFLSPGAAGVPHAAGFGALASDPSAAAPTTVPPSPIVKPLLPAWFVDHGNNAEMRWDSVSGRDYRTPNERFFVRDHTSTPLIDAKTWRLRVFGAGLRGAPDLEHAIEFDYRQLRALPSHEIEALIECAGNGRRYFAGQQGTPTPGTPWGLGAIGLARWRGVLLSQVLHRAGIRDDAVDVMPQGLDASYVCAGVDHGRVRRPLPVQKALDDVLLAYEMNGEPLPPDHGFPVRLVVPGWVGVASIKWVGQIEVSDRPLTSPWNTTWYRFTGPDYPDGSPLTTPTVRSAFELAWDARLPVGVVTTLTGRSWSGNAPIRRVDISTDGGRQWQPAHLHGPNRRDGWVRWQLPWRPTTPGPHVLMARAIDEDGAEQPDTVPYNDGGYMFWAVVRHPVTVTG
jgi:DMSO/TMAO reductase YedYZ molybdopterin-dependent catalytic subunit